MSKTILVVGATGKQGKAVLEALLAAKDAQLVILALTRDVTSASAKALAAKSTQVRLVQGNLDDCEAIFTKITGGAAAAAVTPVWGVFSVQAIVGKGASIENEERQGKALVEAAIRHGVRHFVYSSVDRHGANSDHDATVVPHFASKHRIELHLKKQAAAANGTMTYTILRPTGFMENLSPDMIGKVIGTAWKVSMSPTTPLASIATSDIGFFATQAFLHPDDATYHNAALSLAGDNLSFNQTDAVFQRVLGHGIPTTFGICVKALLRFMGDLSIMYKWFDDVGYDVDIPALRKLHPGLLSWEDWLKRPESAWRK
ncbi:MAG: hypothetical protein M1826_004821 [Phylliscum demangeonii]|nr:MAG: hypothetical protein M1826_004821 [Phylliscum demangeonii]